MGDPKQEAIDGWKEWHGLVRAIIGAKVNERNATLDAIRSRLADANRMADALETLIEQAADAGWHRSTTEEAREALAEYRKAGAE